MTSTDIIDGSTVGNTTGQAGNLNIKESIDNSARWIFHPITEANPYRTEFETERVVMGRLRAGTSVFDLVAEAEEITAQHDPWPQGEPTGEPPVE